MTKVSLGVILCRIERGRPEVLLVHKRYSYAFAEFVHGRYVRRPDAPVGLRLVSDLLDRMTTEELLDVWSLNFDQMWYRVWLGHEKREMYTAKLTKFRITFMGDGGQALRRMVQRARSRSQLLWEVPKGRRNGPREADVVCAARELHEETGIAKSEYRLIPGARRRVCYVSAGTQYVCQYYIGVANPHVSAAAARGQGCSTLREIGNMGEVSESRWHSIEQLRMLDADTKHLEALVGPAFALVKRFLKGSVKNIVV